MVTEPTRRYNLIAAIQQDDPSQGPEQLIADYQAGPQKLRAAIAGMTHDELLARPIIGKWSTLEVVCHVCDAEQFFADRLKRTRAMSRPLLLGADPDHYPEAVRYHDRDLEEELALVALTRGQVARILKLVPAEAWQQTAIHNEGGLVTLRQLVLHATRHLTHHVRFIAQKREALAAASNSPQGPGVPVEAGAPHEVERRGDFFISTDPSLLSGPRATLATGCCGCVGVGFEIVDQKPPTAEGNMARVIGIGGVFFRSGNPDQLYGWYEKHLGLQRTPGGVLFPWREADQQAKEQTTVWSLFPTDTKYFGPANPAFMVNYIVDDLDGMVADLRAASAQVEDIQDSEYGRFAWVTDPEGNRIELWQPPHGPA